MSFRQTIIRWAAVASLVGLTAGSVGLLSQAIIVSTGGKESAALVGTFGALAGTSLTSLGALAALVWSREGNGGRNGNGARNGK